MNLNNSLRKTPVAVVGISAIFADAKNVEEFWTNIVQAKDSITDVPDSRWNIDDYYDPDMTAPDKTYCKRGGFIPDIDFNPMEFGLPPNILEVTDASQLLALIAARDAFEDAGYGKKSEKFTAALKAKTGVLLGVGGGQKLITPLIARLQYPIWERALRASGISEEDIPHIVDKIKKAYIGWNENSFPGLLGNVISGRITNRFDLGGINSVVDAACAASLSAIKMSLSELVEGRCDMMLTGGVDTDNSPFMYMSFSKTPAFSKSGHITPFDDSADGMLIGEGVGMIVLKRLEDAERDGDKIYSIIKGVGTSSDGRFKSVYAPRSSGQALAMERTYEEAGYAPQTVGLLEAHGTGTGAGDPTEFESMQMVFGKDNPRKQHIALGSVKSQIGHTKAAAGAAGMIKTILALHHKVLPPTINVTQPNKKFDIENSAIYINTETRPWFVNGHPRRASVSAFGFGGINVHVAMEEYQQKHQAPYRLHQPYKTILLSANNPTELTRAIQASLQNLTSQDAEIHYSTFIENNSCAEVQKSAARLGFVVSSKEECIAFLETALQTLQQNQAAWTHPKGIYYAPNATDTSGKVVALFSGQGAQYVGMGKELINAFPIVNQVFTQMNTRFEATNKTPITNQVYPIPVFNKEDKLQQQIQLTKTENAQPAIGTLSMGMYKVLQNAGFKPDFTGGHSFGELTALWAAGVYDDDTYMALAQHRGEAMSSQSKDADSGTMMAVKAPLNQVENEVAQLEGVTIANINSTNQVVLGGSKVAMQNAENILKQKGYSVISLPVSAAFHTQFVEHAQRPFASYVSQYNFNTPSIPVYANTTGASYPNDVNAIKAILQDQIINPVLFKNEIENIHQAGGSIFIEFGPKGILTNLVKDILKGKDFQAIAMNQNAKKDSDLQFRQAVVQLQVLGLPIGNIDSFKVASKPSLAKTKLNVALGGHNYVSTATQKAYQDVLTDNFKISGGTQVIEKPIIKEIEKIVEVERIIEVPVAQLSHNQTINEDMNKKAIEILKATLEHFKTQQSKSLDVFERFLAEQNQQSNQLLQMLSEQMQTTEQQTTTAQQKSAPVNFTNHNITTSSINSISDRLMNGNGNGTNVKTTNTSIIEPNPNQTQIVETTAQVNNVGLNKIQMEEILLTVISEKTGYPTEMLELSMDMEADLGIDSIKRVEIFGAMTENYPEMSGINPQELTELRTLGEIVNFIAGQGSATTNVAPPTPTTTTTTPPVVNNPTTTAPTNNADKANLERILLTVISEKTGYPTEMLELSMDMEADLGIDSIKRVEIFGSMTENHPEISGINPQELTELRTLGEIVNFIAGQGGGSTATATALPPTPQATTIPTPTPAPVTTKEATTPTTTLDKMHLENILLSVISEKTGYPTEMLEMSMDMEADLGIDSIKRVEIFGSMTENHPEISGINPQELTELRTLGQIVDYIAAQGKKN